MASSASAQQDRGVPRRRLSLRWATAATIMVVAFALRVGEIERVSYKPIYDAGSYLSLARQIDVDGDYSPAHTSGNGAARTRGPSAYFPPGFPYFLAAIDLIDDAPTAAPAPHRKATFTHATIRDARFAQLLPELVTVAMIGLVAFECFGELTGLIALALAAVYPVLIELSGVLVAENLLTALMLSAVWAVLRAARATSPRRQLGWVAGAGVLTGLASLTHFNGVLLIVPAAVAIWRGGEGPGARRALRLALLAGTTILTIVPWMIRNAVELHRFIPISDETGMTLVGTYNAASAHYPRLAYKWRYFAAIPGERQLVRQARRMSEPALMSRLQSQAVHYIRAHPVALVEAAGHNLLRLFELEGSYAWRASGKAIGLDVSTARIGVISFWILCVLALLGAAVPLTRRAPRWLWAVPLLFGLSVVLVNVETPRFREPIDPFLILLAASLLGSLAMRLGVSPSWGPRSSRSPE
jgi:4-amino-4-deoxy-L-arabinose transferase-like glycosyltransferase